MGNRIIKKKKSDLSYAERHAFTEKNPVMSWSMYSCWKYKKEDWYDTYCLGRKSNSAELSFGSALADNMATQHPLAPFTRLNVNPDGTHDELEFDTYLDKLHLIGSADTASDVAAYVRGTPWPAGEFKSGVQPWDKKRVDTHGQLTFYSLLLWLQFKIHPDDIDWFLEWAPTKKTESGDFYHKIEFITNPPTVVPFRTKRTMAQCLALAADIRKTHKEMVAYMKKRQALDRLKKEFA